jgi:ParB-like chromosome segregation protein Spo0J
MSTHCVFEQTGVQIGCRGRSLVAQSAARLGSGATGISVNFSNGQSAPDALMVGLDNLTLGEVQLVELRHLVIGESIRYDESDATHVRFLAALETALPPVLVHRGSMAVLDGIHRVHAAKLRGDSSIAAHYVDGPAIDAFVLAVRANTAFGKPLSLAERERAARRILISHPQWSDRAIAESCGLSGKTVGALRARSTAENSRLNGHRLGRDGKVRPVNPEERRQWAAALLRESPQSSLRAIARQVGLSPATVKDVRDRLAHGSAASLRQVEVTTRPSDDMGLPSRAADETVADPALRTADEGEGFVRWFSDHRITAEDWERFVSVIPVSRIYVVADEARARAAEWRKFADAVESRISRRTSRTS